MKSIMKKKSTPTGTVLTAAGHGHGHGHQDDDELAVVTGSSSGSSSSKGNIANLTDDDEDEDLMSISSGHNSHQSSSNLSHQSQSGGSTSTGGTGSGSTSTGDMTSGGGGRGGTLAKKETAHVNRLRFVVLGILLLLAIGVATLVYFITNQTGEEEMEAQYEASSARLIDAFDAIRDERIATLASLAIAAIAHGVDHSRDWPFVSLSFYQERAFTAKLNSGALQISIAPLVPFENRSAYEEYIMSDEAEVDWMEQAVPYQANVGIDSFISDYGESFRTDDKSYRHSIKKWLYDAAGTSPVPLPYVEVDSKTEVHPTYNLLQKPYLPYWEMSPFLGYDYVNIDMFTEPELGNDGYTCLNEGAIVIGDMATHTPGGINSTRRQTSVLAQLLSIEAGQEVEYQGDAMSHVFVPIFDSFEADRQAKAVLVGLFNWGILFRDVVPRSVRGIDLVLKNGCGGTFTYRALEEGQIVPIGQGDHHDPEFDNWEVTTDTLQSGVTADGTPGGLPFSHSSGCDYYLSIYPSTTFAEDYDSPIPAILVTVVSVVFVFAILLFLFYDRLVERRQSLVLQKAVQSTAIVSSLFPKNVRDRLMNTAAPPDGTTKGTGADGSKAIPNMRDSLMKGSHHDTGGDAIADLFPNCTVLFADIAGFTAWSSTRSPEQVFCLLQAIYQAFDKVALRRRVFKVETIGDSYVAVTGLPEPQDNHAIIMAKFARDCLLKMNEVTQALEFRLGPDTTDLSMRVGLNSGQVTAGVLRGDRARFQLFGDTVNTAARMESTGQRGKIQLSQSTADILLAAGYEKWIKARDTTVEAKGKGILQTYWLLDKTAASSSNNNEVTGSTTSALLSVGHSSMTVSLSAEILTTKKTKKQNGLIDWMTEVMADYTKQIVAKNKVFKTTMSKLVSYSPPAGTICRDELVESFDLVKIDQQSKMKIWEEYVNVELDPNVSKQIRLYVEEIAARYDSTNPFHNFDHASHVTLSVVKLMKRVVSDGTNTTDGDMIKEAAGLSDSQHLQDDDADGDTYGILTSDPLTLFAIVFSALIHDVNHKGISNMQLAKESAELAEKYQNKSLAEQNSFDIAWTLLMSGKFNDLRKAIFPTEEDLARFRQVALNVVLATDIFDKDLSGMRKERWNKIFGAPGGDSSPLSLSRSEISNNTLATIVLEHIIQASDVSHTMQHWHVFTKWNRRLFEEMRLAYRAGRMGSDPATFWYEGELSFFDNYVIPLAKKLKECKVFGVSSSEYLTYAISNRAEWELKGKSIVEEMIASTEADEA